MKRVPRPVTAALLASIVAASSVALAQQPVPPPAQPGAQPAQPRPAQPRPAQPGQPQPGQPAQPIPLPPPGAQPGQPGQPGQAQPGQPPRRPRPMMPPGIGGPGGQQPRPLPIQRPAPTPAPAAGAHGDAHGGAHHCPGHGPNDSPGHINWYQGILGVNNEKAQSASFVDRLLWRYENHEDECDPKNQPAPFLAKAINFGIVALIVFRLGKGPIVEGLAKRKKTIMQDIDAAEALRSDAESRLTDYEKQLARIAERRKELEAEYKSQFEADKKRILAEAEEKAQRLRKDAETRVAQERKQAEADLLVEAVDASIAAAHELLSKRVEQRDQERLADEYLSGLGDAIARADKRQGVRS